ncbi:hypothetical protein KBY96_01385 [Cyanobium sp. ATX 6A2]|uniref:hypothetical protein n=1 Tax=Cyanobium sp. ATX 6A2 TaxID=2823700 RepID=UPI0020CF6AF8|nr:hypothetical protein [Cyanobium sp. ATX 6A2]MCP9886595.1 hypothetical protein [Cyanobium sp. ATX 6A2]
MERPRCPRTVPRRRRPLGLILPLALLLAGCSGTPLGEQLSDSFPDGQAPGEQSPVPGAGPESAAPAPLGPDPAAAGASPAPGAPQPAPATPAPAAVPAPSAAPAPYRLTLRLSGADPAAPAEAVTQALRAAGLVFEVEVIERIPEASAPPQPATTPAPAPAPAPATR